MGVWTPGSFPLSCPRITTPLLGFHSLRVDASNLLMGCPPTLGPYWCHASADGIFPTRKQLWTQLCWCDFPHSEAQLRYWDFSHSEVRIATPLMGFPLLRVDKSNLLMGETPLHAFSNLQVSSSEPIIAWNIWYIYEDFLVRIISLTC